ncbi:MAG TPA: alpha/beta hydrolase [Ktedonobacteraceae bacterium]|jgi:pimeloyl-ACP methyl ester carboxylesterase|nr:alpha/beta hydrolase [Ktedonobacteraceae bacterium]
MMNTPNTTDKVISLRDGRILGYTEYGDPDGKPVFFFHGLPGSRRQRHPDNSIAIKLGARIIAIDRPGYGLSDFQQGRTLLDWPDDVAQLTDALKIDQFAAIGVSGGGPYLLACAYKMPERITSATTISGMGPTDDPDAIDGMLPSMRLGLGIAPRVPWGFVRLALDPIARMVSRNPLGAKKLMPSSAPAADKKAFARPDIQEIDRQDLSEAYRNGAQGAFWEVVLLASPWGFRLEDIHIKVFLWHGEEDTTVPQQMGRYVARTLSNCNAKFYPGEGHTLIYNYWREILTEAVA